MPIDYKDYPANWKTEIRPAVMQRAGEVRNGTKIIQEACCEQCGRLNNSVWSKDKHNNNVEEMVDIAYDKSKPYKCADGKFRRLGNWYRFHISRITLTIAHVDHDKSNLDVKLDRLKAWCQRCHLNYDRHRHIENRKRNTEKRKGLQDLFAAGPATG